MFKEPNGGRARTVVIPRPLIPLLEQAKKAQEKERKAGVRDAHPHDARHVAATLLLEQGMDIWVVQEILGPSTLAVTRRYANSRELHQTGALSLVA